MLAHLQEAMSPPLQQHTTPHQIDPFCTLQVAGRSSPVIIQNGRSRATVLSRSAISAAPALPGQAAVGHRRLRVGQAIRGARC